MIEQLIIAVTGTLAIFLTQSKKEIYRRYACLVGLVGQPFWMIETISSGQWGMFALTILYTFAWMMGVWNHWIRRQYATS